MTRAVLTMQEIDEQIERDQGARFRQYLGQLLPKMDDAYRGEEPPYRKHLGASIIGRECDRQLYLNFRWAKKPKFEGRILRLFNRGHLEEARFLAMLKCIGCEVWFEKPDGGQFKMSGHGGHYGSSLDAILRGIPEDPQEAMIGEFKTHGTKSFNKLEKDGVYKSKPEHYAQMQQYMGFYNLKAALYMAVNKDNDELYAEVVYYDIKNHENHYERAGDIIFRDSPPKRISQSPAWFACKFCDYHSICHSGHTPDVNCRTCLNSQPTTTGEWYCKHHGTTLDVEAQIKGCVEYKLDTAINSKHEM